MAFSELIKNFEKVRAYMRDFYVYGFKTRGEYDARSARSYDDEKRRIESWLGNYMRFTQTADGKNVFLSVDNRVTEHNPFYKAWKSKSFTDGDITLHFILFDILHDPSIKRTLHEILHQIDTEYLNGFDEPMCFDESTVRKKLKEYISEGLIHAEKSGRQVLYSRANTIELSQAEDAISFFSEAAPCGVVGSYILDKDKSVNPFTFKHHYITQTMDADIVAQLFTAMQHKCYVDVDNISRRNPVARTLHLVPLRIYISVQSGRQYLLAYLESANRLNSYRLDYLVNVKEAEPCEKFDLLREKLNQQRPYMWGVNCRWNPKQAEHVEFIVYVGNDEQHIVNRLEREKRCGRIEKIDEHHYRFAADVYDSQEMTTWIRTFICRITQMDFSNRTVENRLRDDLEEMYRMYGIDGGDEL